MNNVIALVGNPNSGKTTIFNKLTGSSQRVGNWPGVTIERKEGKLKGYKETTVVDLPGIYSLSPYSPEEIISRDYILDQKPDAIINVVDGSNLERNLYLTTQILEFGIPTVIALNMMDIVAKRGESIDVEKLSKAFGCPVIPSTALKNEGLTEIAKAAVESTQSPKRITYSENVEKRIKEIGSLIDGSVDGKVLPWYSIKVLEKDPKAIEIINGSDREKIDSIIGSLEKEYDDDAESIITNERYNAISSIVGGASSAPKKEGIEKENISDKVDRIVTNRVLGLPIFLLVMFGIYYIAVQTVGAYGTDWLNGEFEELCASMSDYFDSEGANTILAGFVTDALVAGVGAVLGFLPQMLVLFLLLAILEECGYMSRVAFVMDRIFRYFGLSGKSFIPLLVGVGCGVPGIMASRTIESERDRRITAMTTTFIPCGAKLPVIALIAGALFSESALIAVSIYFLGILMVLLSGIILKKWRTLSGKPSPFIMELPPYHMPTAINILHSMISRGWSFVKKAGTFIVVACAIVWFLSTFDWGMNMVDDMNTSMLADIGNAIRYIFIPVGFGDDWEFSVATITGLLAKENVVGTFGVLFGFDEVSENGAEMWNSIAAMMTPIAGYAFLVFNMLCAPCFAAIGAMHRELGDWRSTGLAVAYQCVIAYVVALIVYNFGQLIFNGEFEVWLIPAVIALAVVVYLLIAKNPFKNKTDDEVIG